MRRGAGRGKGGGYKGAYNRSLINYSTWTLITLIDLHLPLIGK